MTPEFFEIDMPTDQFLCGDKENLILTAPDGFLSYEWSTGETTQSITVDSQGIYGLKVVKDFGAFTCEAQTEIKVTEGDPPPVIEEIRVIDWSANHNSIEVFLEGNSGSYEYAVDGVNWQDSPKLTNLPLQDYTVYVRDAKCLRAVESERLFLLYYDRFFTSFKNRG